MGSTIEELAAQQEPDPNSPLVWRSYMNDHSLLRFLEERVEHENVFKEQLIDYIKHSRKDPKWSTAAGNAITILVRAGALDRKLFRDLFDEFCSGIDQSDLLNFHQLEGMALLIQGADPGLFNADDFAKILQLISSRPSDTRQQSADDMYQLSLAVSHLLDAMADTTVSGLDRRLLHEPLSAYLTQLKGSSDPYLVYQAAYTYQALLCVPDDETNWQAAMRRTGRTIKGVSGLVSAVKGLDLFKLFEGLEGIQKGVSGTFGVDVIVKAAYDGVPSLILGGQDFMDSLKEGLSFTRKRDWYSALRAADALIRDGELATFRNLVCKAPCRCDPAFQWGVCQRLGEMAANPMWDATTRRNAIELLGEIYRDDEIWGQQAIVKQWVLNILMQLATPSESALELQVTVSESLLQKLEACGDDKKRILYQLCHRAGPIDYPLTVIQPEFASHGRWDVEGRLRVLKKRRTMELDNIFVPPEAKSGPLASDDTRFPLMNKVKDFLGGDQKVFLLLGDSGTGKTTFSRQLAFSLWQSYQSKRSRIPLHVNLPTIDKPEFDIIGKQLRKEGFTETQIQEMKQHRKFILICDEYDAVYQSHNLYMSNRLNQPDEWDAQMVITCRSEHLVSDYRDRFQPGDRNQQSASLFQEAVLTPFSIHQIRDHIKQYVVVHKPLWREKDYEQALNLIPTITDLAKNPFMMTVLLDVLPRMVDLGQLLSTAHITRVALYDQVVETWLERSKQKLGEKELTPQARTAFESLSADGFTTNCIEYIKRLAVAIYKEQDGYPIVRYSQLSDEGTWKAAFFHEEHKRLLLEASPLTGNGNQHRFIHRSFLEYGLALAIFDPQDRTQHLREHHFALRRGSVSSTMSFETYTDTEHEPDHGSPLVWRRFVYDYSLLQFLEERVQQEPAFKDQLLAYIEHSKKNEKWRTAAANAITILVRAGVQFIGTDLQGVRIPGADLSYGVFDSVQLQGADMRKVNLRGAWLQQTDLSRTDMTGVQFGELPYLIGDSGVLSCAFSPDGKSLVVGLDRGDINMYSTTNWEMIRTLSEHESSVRGVVFSPDGNLIVSVGSDMNARIWNLESGVCEYILKDHADEVHCVAYSPRGDRVASASGDKTIRLWDPATGNCCQILSGHEEGVLCVVYSPRGDQIASGSTDFTVRLWNLAGECGHIFVGHNDVISGIAFSPQGDQLSSASHDKTIRLWDVESRTCRYILKGHTSKVNDVVYSLKGDQIFSGSADRTVRVWDVQSGTCLHTMTGHRSAVSCIAFPPSGDMIASGGLDKTVRLWDVSFRGSRRISDSHNQGVTDVKCSPQGNLISSCGGDGEIRIWDAEAGTLLRTLSNHDEEVSSVTFSPQGILIGSGIADNTIRLWDVETGVHQHLTGHTSSVKSIAYSPQGDRVASASKDNTVRLWNVTTGEQCGSLNGDKDDFNGVIYSPDGSLIATRGGCTIKLWNVGTMACTSTLGGHRDMIRDVVFSPQGDQLASASNDCTVRLWSIKTGDCSQILTGHGTAVLSVAYPHEGDLLASGSRDKTVRLWDAASGQCRAVVQDFQGAVNGVAWLPSTNANYLVTGGDDGSIFKWQLTDNEGQYHVTRCWSVINGSLTVTGASIQDVRGLSPLNKQLLRQRGAKNEPENLASVVSPVRQPSDGIAPNFSFD
ncbi:hypothetical protein BGX34_003636 [Mortierella sp. NVP85]|nr:hypothetical protein BGX34_003636 [Mortierella sp. NVP85]